MGAPRGGGSSGSRKLFFAHGTGQVPQSCSGTEGCRPERRRRENVLVPSSLHLPPVTAQKRRAEMYHALFTHQIPVTSQQIEQLAQHFTPLSIVIQFLAQTEVDARDTDTASFAADQAE